MYIVQALTNLRILSAQANPVMGLDLPGSTTNTNPSKSSPRNGFVGGGGGGMDLPHTPARNDQKYLVSNNSYTADKRGIEYVNMV